MKMVAKFLLLLVLGALAVVFVSQIENRLEQCGDSESVSQPQAPDSADAAPPASVDDDRAEAGVACPSQEELLQRFGLSLRNRNDIGCSLPVPLEARVSNLPTNQALRIIFPDVNGGRVLGVLSASSDNQGIDYTITNSTTGIFNQGRYNGVQYPENLRVSYNQEECFGVLSVGLPNWLIVDFLHTMLAVAEGTYTCPES